MATTTTINISPKVLTGLLTGLGTAALLGVANAVDAHTFDFLGPWSPVAYPAFTVLVGQAAAWLKRERDAAEKPAAKPAADGSYTVTSLPVAAPAGFDAIVAGPVDVPAPVEPAANVEHVNP